MSVLTEEQAFALPEVSKRPAKKRKGRKARFAIGLVAAVLLVAALPRLLGDGAENDVLGLSDTTVLSYTDLRSSISATGTVESAMSMTVYSTMSYTVMDVHVEVGDYVEEGQLLAELDGEMIRDQISSQQANLNAASKSSKAQLQAAQDNYDNFLAGLESGLNSTLLSAQNQVDTAYDNYIKAETAYERYREGLAVNENTAILNAEASLENAEIALEQAEDAYERAEEFYEDAKAAYEEAEDAYEAWGGDELLAALQQAEYAKDSAYDQLNAAEKALDRAETGYDLAYASYQAAMTGADNALADYETAMDLAWDAYQKALTAQESAKKSVADQLQGYANTLASAKAGTSHAGSYEAIRQLRADLADTKITAPCAGTVTAVYAEVGSPGSGLLFVIEDVEDLVIDTSVKGYDVGTVNAGMKVIVQSDNTGDAEIEGVISRIAPTANKNALGVTDTSTEPMFAAEVRVLTEDSGLRIGMDAQLDYIITEVEHVLTVPYEAVYRNEEDQTCVLAAIEQDDGRFLLEEFVVKTGADDDLDIVIHGAGIEEGMRIVHEPETYLHLLGQSVESVSHRNTMPFGM